MYNVFKKERLDSVIAYKNILFCFLNNQEKEHLFKLHSYNPWWQQLRAKVDANIEATGELAKDISVPLNYYAVFNTLEKMIPRDAIIVSEGANTMVC